MTEAGVELVPLAEELAAVLDETTDFQERAIGDLRDLSEATRLRDEARLAAIAERFAPSQAHLEALGERREQVRARLAAALGCLPREVTLQRLAARLPEPQAGRLRRRRERIRTVAEAVRRQHLETAVLLVEFARVNRALLEGLLPRGAETRTYRTDGTAPWQTERGLLNARL